MQPLTIKIDINHGDRVERVVKIMLEGDFHTKVLLKEGGC